MKKRRRLLLRITLFLFLLAAGILTVWAWQTRKELRASLPILDGELKLAGLEAPVTVTRDGSALPTITARSRRDAWTALGFLHGQERFLQMDLARRIPAGELAQLFGEAALPADRRFAPLEHRARSRTNLARLPQQHREALEAYARGVNAGLARLMAAPPEYLALGLDPSPWTAVDSLLVQVFFFSLLTEENTAAERMIGALDEALPRELVAFLTPSRTRWDRPLLAPDEAFTPAEIPGPEVFDLRGAPPREPGRVRLRGQIPGSNAWAVCGPRTTDGRAIVANDPHLGLRVPGVWYRASLEIARPEGPPSAHGATLPGTPGLILGENGAVAWGLTNGPGDQEDLVLVREDPSDPSRYLTADGPRAFERREVTIAISGGGSETRLVEHTQWGPVVGLTPRGTRLALRSVALEPGGLNLGLLDLLGARTLDEAAAVAAAWRGPAQNVILAANPAEGPGEIGWILAGQLPVRPGHAGHRPRDWARDGLSWSGWIPDEGRPRLLRPEGHAVFSANGRTVAGEGAPISRFWGAPWRTARLAELLDGAANLDEAALSEWQHDTRVRAVEAARALLLEVVSETEGGPLGRARALARDWDGQATASSRSFGLLARLRERLAQALIGPLIAPAAAAIPAGQPPLVYEWPLADEVVARLLEERPAHLLPPGWSDPEQGLRAEIEACVRELEGLGLLGEPWGRFNRASIRHPLSRGAATFPMNLLLSVLAIPPLDLAPDPLPGHAEALRAQTPVFGASLRLVVAPGMPGLGSLTMPGGQSGHPWSPHYRDLHADWVEGRRSPLLPGRDAHGLRLLPAP